MIHSPDYLDIKSFWRARDDGSPRVTGMDGAAYADAIREPLRHFYLAAPAERLRYLCWDLDHGDRQGFLVRLEEILQGTDEASFAWKRGQPLAAAFAVAMNPACAILHMWVVEPDPEALELAGSLFCEDLSRRYKCLLALLPQSFRGGIALARRLGFRKVLSLPMACPLASFRKEGRSCRRVTGLLMAREV